MTSAKPAEGWVCMACVLPLIRSKESVIVSPKYGYYFPLAKRVFVPFLIFATEAFLAVQKVVEVPSALALFPNL